MNLQATNADGEVLFEADNLAEMAAFLQTSVGTLKVGLSTGKGIYKRGGQRGKSTITVTQAGPIKPGPVPSEHVYLATYPIEPDIEGVFWATEHLIELEEIERWATVSYEKAKPATIGQRLTNRASFVMYVPTMSTWELRRCEVKRYPAAAWATYVAQLEATDQHSLAMLAETRETFVQTLPLIVEKYKRRR